MRTTGLWILCLLLTLDQAPLEAKPLPAGARERTRASLEATLGRAREEPTTGAAIRVLREAFGKRPSFTLREGLVTAARDYPGPALDSWMRQLLGDGNAQMRRLAASTLGAAGSRAVEHALREMAENDPETDDWSGGCIVRTGHAREAARAALTALEARLGPAPGGPTSREEGWLDR